MCGILIYESNQEPLEHIEYIKRRGISHYGSICRNGMIFTSTVLTIRSFAKQPVSNENFIIQYNGEIFNDEKSDTKFIQSVVEKNFALSYRGFELLDKIYEEINLFENDMALAITIDDCIFFFKDDIGKRSLGYNIEPFILSSVLYDNELDSMKFYCYNIKDKTLTWRFKPMKNIIKLYMSKIEGIRSFFLSDKYINEYKHLNGYDLINENFELRPVDNPVENLIKLMNISVKSRMYPDDPIIFFSGGIDSVIVALFVHLNAQPNKTMFLINTAFPGSFDRKVGKMAFEDLSVAFPDRNFVFIENDLEIETVKQHAKTIKRLMYPKVGKMDFNISIILYFTAMKASSFGKVAFLGSGADEVFGGYNKYKKEDFRTHQMFDLFTISTHNLCRDDRMISNWSIEARFPFLDSKIIEFSMSLEDNLLVSKDGYNKVIVRKILKKFGFERASEVLKKAMQYGTGISKYENEFS